MNTNRALWGKEMNRKLHNQEAGGTAAKETSWTFFTNHSHVLILMSLNPEISVREMSSRVGITERAVLRILSQLSEAKYVKAERVGRRNRYLVDLEKKFRHPIEAGCKIKGLISMLKKVPQQ